MSRSTAKKSLRNAAKSATMPAAQSNQAARPHGRGPLLAGLALLSAVAIGATLWLRHAATPSVVAYERIDALDPDVSELLKRMISAARSAPRNAAAHGKLGLAYAANQLWNEARKCFEHAARLDPSEVLWPYHHAISLRQTHGFEAGLAALQALAERSPQMAPLQHRLGQMLLDAGRLEEAAAAFQAATAAAPQSVEPRVGLADVLVRRGEAEAAQRLLSAALQADPDYRHARYVLGMALRAAGQMQEAERELLAGSGARPRFMRDALTADFEQFAVSRTGRMQRATALLNAGKPEEAARLLEQVVRRRSNDADALNNLASAYMRLNQLHAAHDALRKAEQARPNAFATHLNLAVCFAAMGRDAEAMLHAERAVALAPRQAQTRFVRAQLLTRTGRLDEARREFLVAARLNPRNAEAWNSLGDICLRMSLAREATEAFSEATRVAPDALIGHLGLAWASLDLGEVEHALIAWERAKQIAPDSPAVQELAVRIAGGSP